MVKTQVFLLCLLILFGSQVVATSQVTLISVNSISNVDAIHSGTTIGQFQVDDDVGDFRLSFKSKENGTYIFNGSNGINDGENRSYTVDVVYTTLGTLGRDTSSTMTGLNLSTTKNIDYNENPTNTTSGALFDIKLYTDENKTLFNGVFIDTINITISPL